MRKQVDKIMIMIINNKYKHYIMYKRDCIHLNTIAFYLRNSYGRANFGTLPNLKMLVLSC